MASEVTHVEIASIWIDVSIREQHDLQAEATRHPVEEGADVTDHVRENPDTVQIEGVVTNQPIELPGSHVDGATADESGFQLTRDAARATGTTDIRIEGEPTLGLLGLVPGVDQAATLLRTFGPDARSKKQLTAVVPKLITNAQPFQANALRFSKEFDRVRAVREALWAAFKARKPVQLITGLIVYDAVVLTDLSVMRDASSAGTLHFGATAQIIRIVKSATGIVGAPDPVNARGKPGLNKGNQNTAPVAPAEIPDDQKAKMSALEQLLTKGVSGLLK